MNAATVTRSNPETLERSLDLLREARMRSGLSLRQLATRAGTSHATLLAYENGRKIPAVSTFLRILEACGFAVDLNIAPRIRERDGLDRGEELAEVLLLAEQFPAHPDRRMIYPRFGPA
jgi:transcriptional regulator with XRE-family HTH domain